MKTRTFVLLASIVIVTLLLLAQTVPLAAHRPDAPGPGLRTPSHWPEVPADLWTEVADRPRGVPEGSRPPAHEPGLAPEDTGGPDDFGYTWDDSVAYSWVDGTTNTGLSDCEVQAEVPIGFPFKYYENTYTSVYVSLNGFLSMQPEDGCYGGRHSPNPSPPNNTIAPYWVTMQEGVGQVRYVQGGTEPNRYLVVEWHAVQDFFLDSHTFEAVLHENGDVTFAYQAMNYGGACAGTGIEDSTGTDGLEYQYCSSIPDGKAVRFYRPPPQYRVRLWPLHVGSLASLGETVGLQVPLRNTGDLGPDTYNLAVSSVWPVALYAPDGVTPLTDTDGDGLLDTGSVNQAETFTVTAQVQVPGGAVLGDHNQGTLTATSSGDPGKSKTATVDAAVPAPFAQVYEDDADGAMGLDLVQTAARATRKSARGAKYGSDPAVAETAGGGFAYIWPEYHWTGSVDTVDLWVIVYDRYGHALHPAAKLTDNSAASVQTTDSSVGVAAAPDGRIGVMWIRYLFKPEVHQYNRNVYFAVLDAAGQLIHGPTNVTNNDEWGWSFYWPDFFDSSIAATDDSRFVLAWQRTHGEPSGWVKDVYYTVRNSSGVEIKAITRWTFDPVDFDGGYGDPNLARLSGSRVLLTWCGEIEDDILYGVLNSDGGVVRSATNLSADGSAWVDWGPDGVQLPNGSSVIAWTGESGSDHRIRYAVLNSAYNRTFGPATLDDPGTVLGSDDVSVTADGESHATLTWMEYSVCQMNLYYALLDGIGGLVSPPMPFHTSPAGCVYSSHFGFGNTSYSWTPPADVDGVAAFEMTIFRGAPGGSSALQIRSANHGTRNAQHVVVTLTLDPNLSYLGDTSGIPPSISGNDVIWNLPDLAFLDEGGFTVYVSLPVGDPLGTTYPVVMNVASDGPEWNPDDNTAYAEVVAVAQLYLPLILR